jgi:hypothetical protein
MCRHNEKDQHLTNTQQKGLLTKLVHQKHCVTNWNWRLGKNKNNWLVAHEWPRNVVLYSRDNLIWGRGTCFWQRRFCWHHFKIYHHHHWCLKNHLDTEIKSSHWVPTNAMVFHTQDDPGSLKMFEELNGHFRNLNWRYLPYIRPI